MRGSLINQGLELMLFGMGTVLAFLTVLVFSIILMSWILARFFPLVDAIPDVPAPPKIAPDRSVGSVIEDATVVAVISAAIHKYRSNKLP